MWWLCVEYYHFSAMSIQPNDSISFPFCIFSIASKLKRKVTTTLELLDMKKELDKIAKDLHMIEEEDKKLSDEDVKGSDNSEKEWSVCRLLEDWRLAMQCSNCYLFYSATDFVYASHKLLLLVSKCSQNFWSASSILVKEYFNLHYN